jgi:hypothetical protein
MRHTLSRLARQASALASFTVPFAFTALAGCHHHPTVVFNAQLSPALEAQADAQSHAATPDGQRLRDVLVGVANAADEGASWMVPLQVGQCYAFGYAADPSVSRFSLYLFSPSNKRLDSLRGAPGQGVFRHCPKENGMFRLEGKVPEGAGHFVVVTYVNGAAVPVPTVAVVAPTLNEIIDRQAASAAPGATRVGDFFSGVGDQTDWYTQLNAGTCYWFIGAGDAGAVKSLYLYLWDPRSARLTENRSETEMSMVGYCPTVPGMYKFEAKLNKGHGAYKVGVYAK